MTCLQLKEIRLGGETNVIPNVCSFDLIPYSMYSQYQDSLDHRHLRRDISDYILGHCGLSPNHNTICKNANGK